MLLTPQPPHASACKGEAWLGCLFQQRARSALDSEPCIGVLDRTRVGSSGHGDVPKGLDRPTNPCELLPVGLVSGQPAPNGFKPSSARRSLQAASSLM